MSDSDRAAAVPRIFADFAAAADHLKHLGLDPVPPLATLSPALTVQSALPIRRLDAGMDAGAFERLAATTAGLAEDLREHALKAGHPPEAALMAARASLAEEQLTYRAMMLEEADFSEPVVVCRPDFGAAATPFLARLHEPLWPTLLAGNPRLRVISVPMPPPPASTFEQAIGVEAGLLTRLAFEPWESLAYRAAERLFQRWPWERSPGLCWLSHESGLAKEAATHLLARGFLPRRLPPLPGTVAAPPDPTFEAACRTIAEARLGDLLIDPARAPVAARIAARAAADVARFTRARAAWEERLGMFTRRPSMLLMGPELSPEMAALTALLAQHRIPVAAVQHGMNLELRRPAPVLALARESTLPTLFATFNASAARLAEEGPGRLGRAHAVGASADMRRCRQKPGRAQADAVMVVSTALHMGALQAPSLRGCGDIALNAAEAEMVDRLLGGLNKPVLFKSYPNGNRYLDPDPLTARLTAHAHIQPFGGTVDVRYLFRRARVLITGRATSTFGWCLASGLPLVLLDRADQVPFRDDLVPLLEAALFRFDPCRPGALEAARDLLNRPFAEIEAEWAARAEARGRLRDHLFGPEGRGAGRRLASALTATGRTVP